MAIFTSEYFDSYANNDNLRTKNGGTGWTTSWATSSTSGVIVSSTRSETPSLSTRKNTTAYRNATRQHTFKKDLKYTFHVYRETTINGDFELFVQNGFDNVRFRVANNTQWNIDINGTTQANQSGWANNQWNKVEIAINQTSNTVKVSLNETAEVSYAFSNSGNNFYELIIIWPTTSSNIYVDSITLDDDLTFDKDKGAGYRFVPQLTPFAGL